MELVIVSTSEKEYASSEQCCDDLGLFMFPLEEGLTERTCTVVKRQGK